MVSMNNGDNIPGSMVNDRSINIILAISVILYFGLIFFILVFTMKYPDPEELILLRLKENAAQQLKLTDKDIEPIVSQFTLSYNTALNLLDQHTNKEIEIILKKSFDYYLKKKKYGDIRVMASFHNKVKTLQKMGYVTPDNKLTDKGKFARMIYAYELLIAELCTSGLAHQMNDIGFLTTLGTIMFEAKRGIEY